MANDTLRVALLLLTAFVVTKLSDFKPNAVKAIKKLSRLSTLPIRPLIHPRYAPEDELSKHRTARSIRTIRNRKRNVL